MQPRPQMSRNFSNIFDHVDGVPDAIGELCNFLHLRWSPNRSIAIRLDAADLHDSNRPGKQVLNFDSEVRQDAGDAARSDPLVDILVRCLCVRATMT